jgi:hypothetical protein
MKAVPLFHAETRTTAEQGAEELNGTGRRHGCGGGRGDPDSSGPGPGLLESVYEGLLGGFLLNFGGGTMKEGIKRIVRDLPPAASPRLRINQ